MNKTELDKQMFIANATAYIGAKDAWEYLPALEKLLQANTTKRLNPSDWYFGMAAMQASLKSQSFADRGKFQDSEIAWADRFFENLGGLYPGVPYVTDYVRQLIKEDSGIKAKELNALTTSLINRSSVFTTYAPKAGGILSQIYELTKTNDEVAVYWERLVARDLGSVTASSDEILASNPSLGAIHAGLKGADNVESGLQELKKQIKELTKQLAASASLAHSSEALTDNRLPDPKLEKIVLYLIKQKEAHSFDRNFAEYEAALRGTVAIYGALGGDARTLQQISTVLNTVSGMRQAIGAYNQSIATGAGFGNAGLALAGTWVTLAVVFISVMNDQHKTGPTFEDYVVSAISKIFEELNSIHRELRDGLIQIDKRMVELSDQIVEGFSYVLKALAENKWETKTLTDTTYSLSQTIFSISNVITERLDYLIDREDTKKLLGAMCFTKNFGRRYSQDEYQKIVETAITCLNEGKESVLSGKIYSNIVVGLRDVVNTGRLEDLGRWEKHFNSYRSLLSALNQEHVTPMPNPSRLCFAINAIIQIHVNNASEDVGYYPAVINDLQVQCEVLLTEAQDYRDASSAKKGVLLSFFTLLMKEYQDNADQVAEQVRQIHQAKLAECRISLDQLGEYPDLESSLQVDADYYPGDVEILPLGLAESISTHFSYFGFTDGKVASDDVLKTWRDEHPNFVSSVFGDGAWKAIKLTLPIWLSFPIEKRRAAYLCHTLGVGELAIGYQAGFDKGVLEECGIMFGSASISYCLGIKYLGTFRPISLSYATVGDGIIFGYNFGYADTAYLKKYIFNLKEKVVTFQGCPNPLDVTLFPGNAGKFIETADLIELAVQKYSECSQGVLVELRRQLDVPDSPLGETVKSLSAVTSMIRGISLWLFSDLLASDSNLRRSLFGLGYFAHASQQNRDYFVASLRNGESPPLLDKDMVHELMLSTSDFGAAQPPTLWPRTATLQEIRSIAKISATAFLLQIRNVIEGNVRGFPMPEVQVALDDLRRFSKHFKSI